MLSKLLFKAFSDSSVQSKWCVKGREEEIQPDRANCIAIFRNCHLISTGRNCPFL
jgi:hypothetical protein